MTTKNRDYQKKLSRLVRILNRLETEGKVTPRELAEEFNVTMRTAQRDLELINMAEFPLVSPEKGVYSFMPGFSLKSHPVQKRRETLSDSISEAPETKFPLSESEKHGIKRHHKPITVLDVGGDSLICLIGFYDSILKKCQILGGAERICHGIRAGRVIQVMESAVDISAVLAEAERVSGTKGSELVLGLGGQLRSIPRSCVSGIGRGRREFEQKASSKSTACRGAEDIKILHVSSQKCAADQTNALAYHGPESRNLAKAVQCAGWEVTRSESRFVGLSSLVVPPKGNIKLLDFSIEYTAIGWFIDGEMQYCQEVPAGLGAIYWRTQRSAPQNRATGDVFAKIEEQVRLAHPGLPAPKRILVHSRGPLPTRWRFHAENVFGAPAELAAPLDGRMAGVSAGLSKQYFPALGLLCA